MKRYLFFALTAAALLYGCSSGKKQLQYGNYEESVDLAVERLRKSPNNKKAMQTLREAYPLAVDYHMANIVKLKNSSDRFKYDKIVDSYAVLNNMHQKVQRCPACRKVIPDSREFYEDYMEAINLAADERYQAGNEALALGTRESAKEAYRHFQRIESIKPNYRDTRVLLDESLWMATLKVIVEPIPVAARSLELSAEFFENRYMEYINSNPCSEFVRFFDKEEAAKLQVIPDQIMVMAFDHFNVGQVYFREREVPATKDSVIVGTYDKEVIEEEVITADADNDGDPDVTTRQTVRTVKENVYGTVRATVRIYSKTITSNGVLDFKIIDARTGSVLTQEKMPGEFVWRSEWANFNGDERALTQTQLELTRLREAPPPPPQVLFTEFTRPIFDQMVTKVRRYYRYY